MRHIVVDADGEAVARLALPQFVEHRFRHRRIEILRRQPVAATDHQRHAAPAAMRDRLRQRIDHVQIKRLAWRARLLGLFKHCNRTGAAWQRREKCVDSANGRYSRTCSTPTRSPSSCSAVGGRARRLGAGTHQDNDPFGVRGTVVVEQVILPPGQLRQTGPSPLHDRRHARVKRVCRLARLKKRIGIMRRAAD